jgi:mRNA-degrading endonuclease RelE of RelBE toxin-antitoxin system
MKPQDAFKVRFAKAAAKQFRDLSETDQQRVRTALIRQAKRSEISPGSRGGKSLKQIQGRHDRFFRLRVGDLRVMFDLLDNEHVLLVLGIVNRRDLERWLRNR